MDIPAIVSAIISTIAPLVEVASPTAAKAVDKVASLLTSAIAGEHDAVALIEQIKSGTPATAAQLKLDDAALDAAIDDLDAIDDAAQGNTGIVPPGATA